jgi:hypothetical protein
MTNKVHQKLKLIISLSVLTLVLSACSDDKATPAAANKATPAPQTKHADPHREDTGEATVTVKQKFIKQFSTNCVSRELKKSINQESDEKRFADACACIANKISEDLADIDAEKYLLDHEDTQTLEIKFDHAAYFCLQSKPQPKGPHLFGKE